MGKFVDMPDESALVPIGNFFEDCLQERFQCFGCSPLNDESLQSKFYVTKEGKKPAQSVYGITPAVGPKKTSFPHLVHGGILSTIVDDAAYWTLFYNYRLLAVTSEMNMKYLSPCPDSVGIIAVGSIDFTVSSATPQPGQLVVIRVSLYNQETKYEIVKGEVKFYILPPEKLKKIMGPTAEELLPKL